MERESGENVFAGRKGVFLNGEKWCWWDRGRLGMLLEVYRSCTYSPFRDRKGALINSLNAIKLGFIAFWQNGRKQINSHSSGCGGV